MKLIDASRLRFLVLAYLAGWVAVPSFKLLMSGVLPTGVDIGGAMALLLVFVSSFFVQRESE